MERERSKSLTSSNKSASPSAISYDGKVVQSSKSSTTSPNGKYIGFGNTSTTSTSSTSTSSNKKMTGFGNSDYVPKRKSVGYGSSSSSSSSSNNNTTNTEHTTMVGGQPFIKNHHRHSMSIGNSKPVNSTFKDSPHQHKPPKEKTSNTNRPQTSPPKSRMKRLSLTVSVSTKMYLEKIGRGSNSSVDTNDIKELKSSLKNFKTDLRSVKKQGRVNLFNTEKDTNAIQFGDIIKIMGENSLKESSVGKALKELGEQLSIFEEEMKEERLKAMNTMLEPLILFYQQEIKEARELKKKQNLSRIKYEQSTNNLHEIRKKHDPTSSKTKQAKLEEEESKMQYTQLTEEFIGKMNKSKAKIMGDLRMMVKEYTNMQVDYYREAADSWEEFYEVIESILPDKEDENYDANNDVVDADSSDDEEEESDD